MRPLRMRSVVVVDGPNLVNDVHRYRKKTINRRPAPDIEGAYYRDWFDVDRLVRATGFDMIDVYSGLGIVVFHSIKSIGGQDSALSIRGDKEVIAFWARQGSSPHTSTILVNIPGSSSGKEKGVDTSIIVYLYETADFWDSAYLFTNDDDFVPAVWSLRRQGKRVFCSSPTDERASPLVQSCQNFYEWNSKFIEVDLALFEILQPSGPLDAFLARPDVARLKPRVSIVANSLRVLCGENFKDSDEILASIKSSLDVLGFDVNCHSQSVEFRPRCSSTIAELVYEGLGRHLDVFQGCLWNRLRGDFA